MQKFSKKNEIGLLLIVFIIIGIFGIAIKYFEFYNIKIINNNANNIYKHPLKVSNASLTIKVGIFKIHRDMKDVVLSNSKKELLYLVEQIDNQELKIYENFNIIERQILGQDGIKLEKKARELFKQWKPIRDEVVLLIKQKKIKEAINITKGKGAKHVNNLGDATEKLYNYAQNKAKKFKKQSDESFEVLKTINATISVIFFIIFILLSYYVIHRISRYIINNQTNTRLLVQQKKDFETIFNESPTPMAIHNEDGEILMLNKVWEDLTGYKYEEINTTTKWTNKVSPNSPKPRQEHIEKLYSITSRIDEGNFKIITKDGRDIIWAFSSSPFGIKKGKRVLISTATDITELKKKDKMIFAQSRHAAMGEMISMIAHQWRQPLSVISMNTNNILLDVALDTVDTTQLEKHSNDILLQTEHLSQTIDDFRNFFKIDKELVEVKLDNIINETYSIIKDSLTNHNICINIDNKSKSFVSIYPRELMQVFVNIITNSKDILLTNKITNPSIDITIFDNKDYIITQICDNGPGVKKENLTKIFDPYFTTKEEKNGTGLGLYMSRIIVEDHLNGKIEVSNNNGACFSIKLLKSK